MLLKKEGQVLFSNLRTGFVRSAIKFDLDSLVTDKAGKNYMMVRGKPHTCENTYGRGKNHAGVLIILFSTRGRLNVVGKKMVANGVIAARATTNVEKVATCKT